MQHIQIESREIFAVLSGIQSYSLPLTRWLLYQLSFQGSSAGWDESNHTGSLVVHLWCGHGSLVVWLRFALGSPGVRYGTLSGTVQGKAKSQPGELKISTQHDSLHTLYSSTNSSSGTSTWATTPILLRCTSVTRHYYNITSS